MYFFQGEESVQGKNCSALRESVSGRAIGHRKPQLLGGILLTQAQNGRFGGGNWTAWG